MNRTRISLLATALVLSCAGKLAAVVQVTVQSPAAGATVGSPTQFAATATSANPITGFVVYANNQNVLQVNASSLNGTANLSAGAYSIYVRAWDSTGAFGTSATFSITVSTTTSGVQVTVQSPAAGATVGSPTQFTATATSANPITGFVVYANNQNVLQVNASSLNGTANLSAGTYSIYIRAWDSTGAFGTSATLSITVRPPGCPVPPGVRVKVQSPSQGPTAPLVQFAATATSANPITGFVVYANNQNIYQTNNSSLNASIALADSTYNIYVRAWDSTGAYGTSSPSSITVSKNVQVKVGFPSAGALLGTPAHFAATATSANPITGFVVYANNQNVLQVNASSLNGTANLSAGTYNIYIRAWDSTGGYGTSSPFSITVGPTLPTPPPTAIAFDGIDDSSVDPTTGLGWGSCVDACCAGGAADADASSSPAYQFQTTPSLDGASTEFMISGPAFADALHWYKLGPQNSATNYLWDFWTYLDDNSLTAQAIEFDAFAAIPFGSVNRKFMFGSQCNYASGVWDGWTEGGGAWVPTTITCTKFSPNTWHHGIWYFKRVGPNLDQLQYVSLTLDGVTFDANMLQLSQPTTWDQVLGVQYQQDLGPSGTPFHQWVDKVKLTIW